MSRYGHVEAAVPLVERAKVLAGRVAEKKTTEDAAATALFEAAQGGLTPYGALHLLRNWAEYVS